MTLCAVALRDTETGQELNSAGLCEQLGLPRANERKFASIEEIQGYLDGVNGFKEEGFVLRYANGLRVKMKAGDYIAKHKIVFGTSAEGIWEALKLNKFDECVKTLPDEMHSWARGVARQITDSREALLTNAGEVVKYITIEHPLGSRREQALYIQEQCARNVAPIAFALLSAQEKRAEEIAWKLTKPSGRCYRTESVEEV